MKKILLIITTILISNFAFAQYNMVNQYNQHWNLQGSKMLPSKLGMDFSNVQLNFPLPPDPYIYAGNNIIGIGSVMNLDSAEMGRVLDKLRPESNLIGVGVETDIIGFGFKVKKDDEEFMNFSVNVANRTGMNIQFGENFLRLVGQGNHQFLGRTVPLGPIALNAMSVNEFALGWSMPFNITEDIVLRAGTRLKYWQGLGSLYMPKTQLDMTTQSQGKSIAIKGDYIANYTAFTDSPMSARGSGFGVDLGATIVYQEKFIASLAVNDIGGIKYKKDTYSYSASGDIEYQGLQVRNLFTSPELNADSAIRSTFSGVADSGQVYKMPMPTKFVFQGEYVIEAGETNAKERPYNKQVAYLTFIKGFNNMPGTTTRPFVAIGYSYALNYVLNVGTNFQTGGYNKFGWGINTSLRMGPIRFGVGSNSVLTYLISKKGTTGLDFSMNALIAF
jgi:hypothetical protein